MSRRLRVLSSVSGPHRVVESPIADDDHEDTTTDENELFPPVTAEEAIGRCMNGVTVIDLKYLARFIGQEGVEECLRTLATNDSNSPEVKTMACSLRVVCDIRSLIGDISGQNNVQQNVLSIISSFEEESDPFIQAKIVDQLIEQNTPVSSAALARLAEILPDGDLKTRVNNCIEQRRQISTQEQS